MLWIKKIEKLHYIHEYLNIKVVYGLRQIKQQLPRFSITGEVYNLKKRDFDRCGCIHRDIRIFFPELEPLIQWHLTDSFGVPMHYIANGQYWFDRIGIENKALEYFRKTVVFGALETDVMPTENVVEWMEKRLPKLQEAFKADMYDFGCYNNV